MQRESRLIAGLALEERSDSGDESPRLVGYAALFDVETNLAGVFREKIARGAFVEAIGKSDIHALFNHDDNIVLGRMKSGTLSVAEDEKGLKVSIIPPDTQDARDLLVKMKRGDIDQMSFQFTMAGGKQSWDDSIEPPLRTIEKVGELYDVSVVTRGQYPDTEVAVRSLQEFRKMKAASVASRNFSAANLRIRRKMDLEQRLRSKGP